MSPLIGVLMKRANLRENCDAKILGKISQKKSINAVIITTSNMNFNIVALPKSIKELLINDAKITTATFTKLLPISIVASSSSGSVRCFSRFFDDVVSNCRICSMSAGLREKNAISVPEISALIVSSTIRNNSATAMLIEKGKNSIC